MQQLWAKAYCQGGRLHLEWGRDSLVVHHEDVEHHGLQCIGRDEAMVGPQQPALVVAPGLHLIEGQRKRESFSNKEQADYCARFMCFPLSLLPPEDQAACEKMQSVDFYFASLSSLCLESS